MTLQSLKQYSQRSQQEEQKQLQEDKLQDFIDKCQNIPFYNWNQDHVKILGPTIKIHWGVKRYCCFNHAIGLPRKNGVTHSLYDYEKLVFQALMQPNFINNYPRRNREEDDKKIEEYEREHNIKVVNGKQRRGILGKIIDSEIAHNYKVGKVWIKKATGLGITELILRWIIWMCVRNNDLSGSQVVIITGPNLHLAVGLIKRMKTMFEPHAITFDTRDTLLEINNVSIEAFPANNLDAVRSLEKPKIFFLDEADFFRDSKTDSISHAETALSIAERYSAKSSPYIILVSTPGKSDGLFAKIERQSFEECNYKRIYLDYTWGLNKIYTQEEIEKAKKTVSFEREYNLKYDSGLGNTFSHYSIEQAIRLSKLVNPAINKDAIHMVGIDPGISFGICVIEYSDGFLKVEYSDQIENSTFRGNIDAVAVLKDRFGVISNIFVDGSAPEAVEAIKRRYGERSDRNHIIQELARLKKYNINPQERMLVVPINFSTQHKALLQKAKAVLEHVSESSNKDNRKLGIISIPEFNDKLISALRGARSNEYILDKNQTPFNDVLDAFRLALSGISFKQGRIL